MEFFLTFIEGFASFISPCLLPMIPIYISYFLGNDNKSTTKAFINSLGFVCGFTLTFILLSILTSLLGFWLVKYIKYIKIIFGIIIILLGLNYIDILNINFLNKSNQLQKKIKSLNFLSSLFFGILFSLSWTPCIGSFLGSALLFIATKASFLKGFILIILYSLGLGIPFIISSVFLDNLSTTFDFIKKHYNIIKKLSGLILIFMGFYMIFFN